MSDKSSVRQDVEKVQRYDLVTNYRCGSSIEEMERSDDGEWVRYEQVESALSSLRSRVEALEQELNTLHKQVAGEWI